MRQVNSPALFIVNFIRGDLIMSNLINEYNAIYTLYDNIFPIYTFIFSKNIFVNLHLKIKKRRDLK